MRSILSSKALSRYATLDLEWLCRSGRCVVIGFFLEKSFVHQLFAKAKTHRRLLSQPVAAAHHELVQYPLASNPSGPLTGHVEAQCGEGTLINILIEHREICLTPQIARQYLDVRVLIKHRYLVGNFLISLLSTVSISHSLVMQGFCCYVMYLLY